MNDDLKLAIERLLLHWDEYGAEKYVTTESDELGGYWLPAGRMVDTPFIAELRAAYMSCVDSKRNNSRRRDG